MEKERKTHAPDAEHVQIDSAKLEVEVGMPTADDFGNSTRFWDLKNRTAATLRQEKAEYTEKVEQMSSFQAALQRENNLLLEELVSVLGRTKVLNAEMASWTAILQGCGKMGQMTESNPMKIKKDDVNIM